MDPDFMKNSPRDGPFRPPPDNSITPWLGGLLVVTGLLYLGYKSADWWNEQAVKNRQVVSTPNALPPPHQAQPQQSEQTPQTNSGARIIAKCVINGKTTYSDGACAQGAAASQVVTKADHNLVAGLTQEQMATVKRIDAQAATAITITQNSPVVTNTAECKALDVHIAHLDAMARQPQEAQVQDWIKERRKTARDRQFAIRCQ